MDNKNTAMVFLVQKQFYRCKILTTNKIFYSVKLKVLWHIYYNKTYYYKT